MKFGPEEYGLEKFKPKGYEECIAEGTKIRRQKKSDEKNTVNELNKQDVQKDKIINKELFEQYFRYQSLVDMQKDLCKTKNTDRNKIQVDLIKIRLEKFKGDINRMSEDEIEIEKPLEIVPLDFNQQGLEILTPQQFL